jgi:hypothetical protein
MKKFIFYIYLLPVICFEKARFANDKTKCFDKARLLQEISPNSYKLQQTLNFALQSADCSQCCCCEKGFSPEYSLQHVFGCQCKNLICCGAHLREKFCPNCNQPKNQSQANAAYGNSELMARLIEDNRRFPQWSSYQNFNPNLFDEETSWPIFNVIDKCPEDLSKIIATGANVNITDLAYNTPLEFALKKIGTINDTKEKIKLSEAVCILINNGACLNLTSTYRGKSCTVGYLLAQFAPECLPLAHQKGLDIVSAEEPEDLDLLDGLLENCDGRDRINDFERLIKKYSIHLTDTNLLSTYYNPLLFSHFFKKSNLSSNHKLLHAALNSSNYSVLGALLTRFRENLQKNSSFYKNTESWSPENNYCFALLDTYNNPKFSKLKLKPVENFNPNPLPPYLGSPEYTTAEVIDECESDLLIQDNINQPDIDDYTPLQKAVIHHLTSKVQYLLQKGADPRAKNMINESARSINKRLCHYYLTCLQKNYQNYQSNGTWQEYRETRRHFKDLYSSQLAINKILK